MPLNIYIISHPIIKILSNPIINTKENQYTNKYYYEKYLGFLLIYETLRKYVKIRKFYIKSLKSIRNFYLTNTGTKYLIFTHLSTHYKLIADISILLPDIEIINIEHKIHSNFGLDSFFKIQDNTNTFILESVIKDNKIIDLVEYLHQKKQIKLDNINIVCISSYQKILSQLNYKYPKLKVYTTEIIYNKK
uniref:Uracil phosphoribosyltransferase n=1 Tax=Osmundaria fimbriata TaxID=228265 RepID=A0A1Z1M4G8_OSMFI|nr:uracil phosphoribosyltransferase [Osmundaria fimbriata]ARW60939.1 uracil phosphoribosyltransferase [Osmundaria fimbriata]